MKNCLTALCLTVMFISSLPRPAHATAQMPDTPAAYTSAAAWTRTDGDRILAAPDRIAAMDAHMAEAVHGDIRNVKDSIGGAALRAFVTEAAVSPDLYIKGKKITPAFAEELRNNSTARIREENPVAFAIVTERANIRVFPTEVQAFETPADTHFDAWQCSAVDPATPVRVYVYDGTGDFCYVRAPGYRGWIPSRQIALTDRGTWEKFVQPASPAVVTGRLLTLPAGDARQVYQMGAAIPTENGSLLLPVRDASGDLRIISEKPYYNASLHKGYLPYTANNIIAMAFRHLGAPYGWGGLESSVDCSAFVQDVYRTMGIDLPRNSGEQARSFPGKDLRGLTLSQKLQYIRSLPPGALLFKKSHVMLYLGEKDGVPYMIHALGSFGERDGNEVRANYILEVVVSKVDLLGRSGVSLARQLTKANVYE